MRKLFLLLVLFQLAVELSAQSGSRERRDTALFGAGGVIEVPVFSGQTTPVRLHPVSQPICFNYQFYVKTHLGGRNAETCFMVNTEEGTVGMKEMVTDGTPADCALNIDDKKFVLNVVSKEGNAFGYFNVSRRNEIKHYVRTNNSHINPVPAPDYSKTVYKKTEKRMFCDGTLEAWSYKADGEKDILFLHGSSYPEKLDGMQYLGAYGLGFVQTAQGNYLCLGIEHGDNELRVLKIDKDRVCFNPTPFVVLEQEFGLQQTQANAAEREQLEKKQQDITKSTQPCREKKQKMLDFEKEVLAKNEDAVNKSSGANPQQDVQAKKAIAGATDPTDEVRKEILQIDIDLCFARDSYQNTTSNSSRARLAERIACIENKLIAYKKYERDMMAIDERFPAKPSQAMLEKSKYYMNNVIMRSADYKCK